MDVEVRNFKRVEKRGTHYWAADAEVTFPPFPGKRKKNKVFIGFSRWASESEWYADCQFTNGLPMFNHGEADRCCLKHAAIGEIKERLDAALNAAIKEMA